MRTVLIVLLSRYTSYIHKVYVSTWHRNSGSEGRRTWSNVRPTSIGPIPRRVVLNGNSRSYPYEHPQLCSSTARSRQRSQSVGYIGSWIWIRHTPDWGNLRTSSVHWQQSERLSYSRNTCRFAKCRSAQRSNPASIAGKILMGFCCGERTVVLV